MYVQWTSTKLLHQHEWTQPSDSAISQVTQTWYLLWGEEKPSGGPQVDANAFSSSISGLGKSTAALELHLMWQKNQSVK